MSTARTAQSTPSSTRTTRARASRQRAEQRSGQGDVAHARRAKNMAKRRTATAQQSGDNKEFSKSVGAIVLNSKYQVLLLFQKKNRYWEFPKGKVEAGEKELDTLQREIFEETGIRRFRMVQGFRRVMHYDFRFKGRTIQRKVVYFLIKTSDRVRLSDEHSRYTWMSLTKAKKRLKHKNQVRLLEEVTKQVYG